MSIFSMPSRRTVLLGGAAAVGLAAFSRAPASASPGKLTEPFSLGVASGDPDCRSVVLWTRLAQNPLADNGRGGMPDRQYLVEWEVATDERFRHTVRRGIEVARPGSAHSVHVEVEGLRPGSEYFYRFRTQDHVSPAGRTRTAPAPGTMRAAALTMCFASCANFGTGHFTAYRRLAEDEPGLILHLGDYQYEFAARSKDVRTVLGPETRTLENYRLRHSQYKTDPDLQFAHATAPWLVVWDDHEVSNNWADEVPQKPDPAFLDRRKNAFQAYYENMPLRRAARPRGINMRLYRRVQWGGLITFHMLDTRHYRDDQACGDGVKAGCKAQLSPARSITGEEQERWILDGLRQSRARWDVLGQQVFFSQIDLTPGPAHGYKMDAWDGYKANRDRIAASLGKVRNGVVLTGDAHRHWAAEIKTDYTDPCSRGVGTEFVTTSITSSGDGTEHANAKVLAENPHVKFYKNRRGYIRTKFTPDELRADYRILPYVRQAGGAASTVASFAVTDRDPSLHRVHVTN